MKCHFCGGETRVVETRDITSDKANTVRRRRYCLQCTRTFHTTETLYTGPHRHTLTMQQVKAIRTIKTRNPKAKQADIAAQFGINQTTVSRILTERRWAPFSGDRNV